MYPAIASLGGFLINHLYRLVMTDYYIHYLRQVICHIQTLFSLDTQTVRLDLRKMFKHATKDLNIKNGEPVFSS